METQRAQIGTSSPMHRRDCEKAGDLALVLLLAWGLTLGGAVTSWSQEESPPKPFSSQQLATFQIGHITGVSGNTVQIDNKDYVLRPNVQIQNLGGIEMHVKDIQKGSLVRFHLKQGGIDQLEVMLPE
ncbi:MAG TPA: hypothetical protein VES96_03195 [Nitrospiraceae bacterium]|nr:hypothetical protein [Nitrospiraceae bacterium]